MYEYFKKKGLHFIHVNARSLYYKMSEIRYIAKKTNAAVIAITETWLDDSHTDDSVSIEGYIIQIILINLANLGFYLSDSVIIILHIEPGKT